MLRNIIILLFFILISCNYHEDKHDYLQKPVKNKISIKKKVLKPLNANKKTKKKQEQNHSKQFYRTDSIFTSGIIRIRSDLLMDKHDTVYLLNQAGKIIDFITSSRPNEPPRFNNQDISIRAYYPDYYVIIFGGFNKKRNKYKVLYNGKWLFIPHVKKITIFESWSNFLLHSFVSTHSKNPLRVKPDENSKKLNVNYNLTHFTVKKVQGNWIYVECNMECEGCPENKLISGWIKWKDNNKLLINLFYVC